MQDKYNLKRKRESDDLEEMGKRYKNYKEIIEEEGLELDESYLSDVFKERVKVRTEEERIVEEILSTNERRMREIIDELSKAIEKMGESTYDEFNLAKNFEELKMESESYSELTEEELQEYEEEVINILITEYSKTH